MLIQPGLLYLTRSEWGADTNIPRLGTVVSRSERTEAIVHHTVIIDNDTTKNRWTNMAEVKAKMRQLQTIRPKLGMDVPYNFVMFLMEDGTIVVCEGRGLDRRGAHTKYHNRTGVATALQGNFMLPINLSSFVPGMSRWWGWLRYDMKMVNLGSKHPAGKIAYGHRDFRNPNDTSTWTSCPGDKLYVIIPQLEFKKKEDEDMPLNAEDKKYIKNTIEASVKPVTLKVADIRKSLTGGMFPGIFVKFEGSNTVFVLELAGGIWVRRSVKNMDTFRALGGEGPVIVLKTSQRAKTVLGPPLPDLKA